MQLILIAIAPIFLSAYLGKLSALAVQGRLSRKMLLVVATLAVLAAPVCASVYFGGLRFFYEGPGIGWSIDAHFIALEICYAAALLLVDLAVLALAKCLTWLTIADFLAIDVLIAHFVLPAITMCLCS